jgi:hypothetical protein
MTLFQVNFANRYEIILSLDFIALINWNYFEFIFISSVRLSIENVFSSFEVPIGHKYTTESLVKAG